MWKSNTKSLQCFLIKTGAAWRWLTERLNALVTDDGELSHKCGVHCNSRRLKNTLPSPVSGLGLLQICFKFILPAIEDYNIVGGKNPSMVFRHSIQISSFHMRRFIKGESIFPIEKGLKNALTFNKPTEVCNIVPQKYT